jgi:acetoin utilization deacetylase AcuC-like enzyme/GNAT superfamily N-acetyltransferase
MLLRIRRIHDDTLDADKDAIAQVQEILRARFSTLLKREIERLPRLLRDPLKYRFRSILFVAENRKGQVQGFALLQHASDLGFCYLDYISVGPKKTGIGLGGLLYERVRDEARAMKSYGLFFECLPDSVELCRQPQTLKENRARLRFYERYGAYPIVGTLYETPLKEGDDCPPHLVYDSLGSEKPLNRETARQTVRAILQRKYGESCPPGYIDKVVESFKDDPVRLREPKYIKPAPIARITPVRSVDRVIGLVVNDQHEIHHVRERGYIEAPVRIKSILQGIEGAGIFERIRPQHFPEKLIKEVHNTHFVEYLKRVSANLKPGKSVYPYVFPIRNTARPPKELPVRAGYYCIDTFTPINRNAYKAARGAVDCALTAAELILAGYRLAYALVRPPGHHAEHRSFGGFCYFNSAAVAAHFLSAHGKVAVLDIDYHHGNGTQDIFYQRRDVLTLSIHGHPSFAYPYFSGFAGEHGAGPGKGFNVNLPLPQKVDGPGYLAHLNRMLQRVVHFRPRFLIVALGFDPAKLDPTGTWELTAKDFGANGNAIGSLGLPTLVVQEGGYRVRTLGSNARHFFEGLWKAAVASELRPVARNNPGRNNH